MAHKTKAQKRKAFYEKIGMAGGSVTGASKARGDAAYYAKLSGLRKTFKGGKPKSTS
jgi:hypothetical protein